MASMPLPNKAATRMARSARCEGHDVRSRRGRRGPGSRQWHRHPSRIPRPSFSAFLHDETDGRGHRPRPFDQLRHRHPAAWRRDRSRQRGWRIYRVHDPPAAAPPYDANADGVMSVSILIVDDEPDVAELFRQHFRRKVRQGLYVLHFAYSAEDALQMLADGIRPELIVILSDINMPGIDGLALLCEIKKTW